MTNLSATPTNPRDPHRQPRAGSFPTIMALSGTLLLTLMTMASPATPAATATDNQSCLRCHAMATLAYRDPGTGEIVDLAVNPHALTQSVHGELDCIDCHEGEFDRYPHPADAANETLSCIGCHEKDDTEDHIARYQSIDAEYVESVHATSDAPEVEGFSCHSCHDPHGFRASQVGEEITAIVRDDNQVCLSCHEKVRDPLSDPHAWLPNREKHWNAVRCLDCHTPLSDNGKTVSHQVLKAEDSNRDCVNCHSKEPSLLNRLYQYRSEEDLATKGWLNKAVFNDAYVVGMSRNATLDLLGLIVIGLTLLVLAAHGFGRYKAYQRTKGDPK